MKSLIASAVLVMVVACGGKQQPDDTAPGGAEPVGVVEDTRTPLEKRLDTACSALEPKLVQCAVDDSRAELAAGRITERQHAELTTPQMQDALRKDWDDKCNRRDRTSRQVRVLEVCFAEETECEPLLDCLEHLNKEK